MSTPISKFNAFLFAAIVAMAPTVARAAGDAGSDGMTLFWQGVNLVLLFALLIYVSRKPIQGFFAERRNQVSGDLDSAAAVLSEAEDRLAEWQARADRLDAEVSEIKQAARQRAETESAHILADAEASAERIRNDAVTAVDQEVARARAALRAEASELATKLAGDLLRTHVSDGDQDKLVNEFVSRIENSGAGNGGAN